jgi:hypothetical protein
MEFTGLRKSENLLFSSLGMNHLEESAFGRDQLNEGSTSETPEMRDHSLRNRFPEI